MDEEKLLEAARMLKENCEKHNFYKNASNLCEGCPFGVVGEPCPFDVGGMPEDWRI